MCWSKGKSTQDAACSKAAMNGTFIANHLEHAEQPVHGMRFTQHSASWWYSHWLLALARRSCAKTSRPRWTPTCTSEHRTQIPLSEPFAPLNHVIKGTDGQFPDSNKRSRQGSGTSPSPSSSAVTSCASLPRSGSAGCPISKACCVQPSQLFGQTRQRHVQIFNSTLDTEQHPLKHG
jgi:hypothetical protein